MYFPSWQNELMYELFPIRRLVRRLRPNAISYNDREVYNTPLPQPALPYEPIIGQEQLINITEYPTMPDPYELPEHWFEGVINAHPLSNMNFHGVSSPSLSVHEEILPFPVDTAQLEITQAIDGVKVQDFGIGPGLDGMLEQSPPLDSSMDMNLEQRIDDLFLNPLFHPLFGPQGPF